MFALVVDPRGDVCEPGRSIGVMAEEEFTNAFAEGSRLPQKGGGDFEFLDGQGHVYGPFCKVCPFAEVVDFGGYSLLQFSKICTVYP